MLIDKQILFFSATNYLKCSREQAVAYFSRLTAINLDRFSVGEYQHSIEHIFYVGSGVLIAGAAYNVTSLPADICAAIAEFLNATDTNSVDITFCTCTPLFNPSSHSGGIVKIFRDGSTQHGSANF